MPSIITLISSPSGSHLDEFSSSLAAPSDTVAAVNILTTATALSAAGQSFKCPDALIAQKQHQLAYIQQQQRLHQEKQRQLLYNQQQRHQQFLKCSGQLHFSASSKPQSEGQSIISGRSKTVGSAGKGKELKAIDLVDDVWTLVFYILACDCKDLGRSMQVNRRFYK